MRSGPLPSEALDCVGGTLVFVGQDAFCVYLGSESDQECSEGTPYGLRNGSSWVCSDDPDPPSRLVETAIFLAQYPEGLPSDEVDALMGSAETQGDGGTTTAIDDEAPLELSDL